MIIYLLKFLACSGILLLFYHFVLQSDRLFKFNRFFLLSIVGLALLIPITTVRTNFIEMPAVPALTYEAPDLSGDSFQYIPQEELIPQVIEKSALSTEEILAGIYLLITLILLARFGRNIYAINRLKKGSDLVKDSGINIVLISDISTSFSFLNYMFTNKEHYKQGSLPLEIIEHEKLHIKQYHSIDIIFIEFLQCIFWFNPFIYFIRKAIKLNHEFLADAFVLGGNTSTYNYQKILLDFTEKQLLGSPLLASNLNYGFTKKRLNMMTKNTNRIKSMMKQIAAAGLVACTFWIGGETEIIAQSSPALEERPISSVHPLHLPDISITDTSQRKVTLPFGMHILDSKTKVRFTNGLRTTEKAFGQITYSEKVKIIEDKLSIELYNPQTQRWENFGLKFNDDLLKKNEYQDLKNNASSKTNLAELPAPPKIISLNAVGKNEPKFGVYGLRANNRVRFKNASGQLVEKKASELTETEKKTFLYPEAEAKWYRITPPVRKLKQEHLDDFLSPSKYGVWLDDKRVENKVLANYKPEDIHHYSKSVLAKNAKNYGKHTFQVNLTTVEHAKTKPYFQNGWVPFHKQWFFSVQMPDNYEGYTHHFTQARVGPNSTVRYINKSGERVETTFGAIEKSEQKWLEHPDRTIEVLLPAKEKAVFTREVLDKYQDSKRYGIWVDDKKISNSELMNYQIDDFHHMRVFNLPRENRKEKSYTHQALFYTEKGASALPSANDRWIPVGVNYIIIQQIMVQND